MDRQKKKKMRNLRVMMTNIFMALSVLALVTILMLVAMGYSFDAKRGIQQSGLVEISSRPGAATVEIDGSTRLERTKISTMLSSGDHKFKITKSGYDIWQRTFDIDPGLLTNIDWVRLFPVNPEIFEAKTYKDLRYVSFSSNRKNMFVVEKDSPVAYYVDLQTEKLDSKKIKLATILGATPEAVTEGTFKITSWNKEASKILLSWTRNLKNEDGTNGAPTTDLYLVDLKNPDKTVNLTKNFNLHFSRALFANDSGSKLWVLESGNLRTIDLANLTISGLIASQVEILTNNKDVAAFVNTDEEGKRAIRIYIEGEGGSSVIKELKTEQQEAKISLSTGTYWSDSWIAYAVDNEFRVLSGTYPSFDKPSKNAMKEIAKQELAFTPSLISVNENQSIILLANGKQVYSLDIETSHHFNYEVESDLTSINWLDEYLTWQYIDNKIVVRDFDGYNRRELISESNNQFGVLITDNDDWLYFFDLKIVHPEPTNCTTTAGDSAITEGNVDTNQNTNCIDSIDAEPIHNYVLRREKLKI